MNRLLLTGAGILCAAFPGQPARAQLPADSVPVWTEWLRTGSLLQRLDAAEQLGAIGIRSLPEVSRSAAVEAFITLNRQIRSGDPIPGADSLGPEDLGAYYMALATMVHDADTRESRLALAQSAGGGAGIQRRAARAGDEAVPLLAERIVDGYAGGDALETMGLAWLWADSTGATLTRRSRETIVVHLVSAVRAGDYDLMRSVPVAIGHAGDPMLLPLARELRCRLSGSEHAFIVRELDRHTIPDLEAAATRRPTSRLAHGLTYLIGGVCTAAARGSEHAACSAMANLAENARRHVLAGRDRAAFEVLRALTARADQALATGAITTADHALITGGTLLLRTPLGT